MPLIRSVRIAATLSILSATGLAAQISPPGMKCKYSDDRLSPWETKWMTVNTGPTAMRVGVARIEAKCGKNGDTGVAREGVLDSAGKELVPFGYKWAYPIDAEGAFVLRDDNRVVTYTYRKGESAEAPLYKYLMPLYDVPLAPDRPPVVKKAEDFISRSSVELGDMILTSQSVERADWHFDAAVYFGTRTPQPLLNLGGRGIEHSRALTRHGDLLVARWEAPDGTERSRLLDLTGVPVSPVLGATAIIVTYDNKMWPSGKPTPENWLARDLLAVGPDFKSADFNVPVSYIPIDASGMPRAMPAGVLAVFPLDDHMQMESAYPGTKGWGVIMEGVGGRLECALYHGTLSDAIRLAPGLRHYVGFEFVKNYPSTFTGTRVALKSPDDGRWRIYWPLQQFTYYPAGATTPGEAIVLDAKASIAQSQREYAIRKAARDSEETVAKAASAKWWAGIKNTGEYCRHADYALRTSVEEVNAFVAACPGRLTNTEIYRARQLGVGEAALASSVAARQKEQEQLAASRIPPPRSAFDQWLDAMSSYSRGSAGRIEASKDAAVQRQQKAYVENLQRYNEGKQNWCCEL